jgi:hypothetical protein
MCQIKTHFTCLYLGTLLASIEAEDVCSYDF